MSTKTDKPGNSKTTDNGPEILFYHLEHAKLLDILPSLLEKSLQRGWQVVVQARSDKQVDELNSALWTTSEDGFFAPWRGGRWVFRTTTDFSDLEHRQSQWCGHPVLCGGSTTGRDRWI